jgi:hypothetical protein
MCPYGIPAPPLIDVPVFTNDKAVSDVWPACENKDKEKLKKKYSSILERNIAAN